MTRLFPTTRRRSQRGSVVRGAIVAAALVGALGLQLAGPRLQTRLAEMAGIGGRAPGAMPPAPVAPTLSPSPCGSSSSALPSHPCKVANAAAGSEPAI